MEPVLARVSGPRTDFNAHWTTAATASWVTAWSSLDTAITVRRDTAGTTHYIVHRWKVGPRCHRTAPTTVDSRDNNTGTCVCAGHWNGLWCDEFQPRFYDNNSRLLARMFRPMPIYSFVSNYMTDCTVTIAETYCGTWSLISKKQRTAGRNTRVVWVRWLVYWWVSSTCYKFPNLQWPSRTCSSPDLPIRSGKLSHFCKKNLTSFLHCWCIQGTSNEEVCPTPHFFFFQYCQNRYPTIPKYLSQRDRFENEPFAWIAGLNATAQNTLVLY